MVAAKPVALTYSATNPTPALDPEPLLVVQPAGRRIVASGRATLVAGTAVVANANALTASNIFLSIQSLGTVTAPKAIGVTARVNGTSFTITSADATDTSVIAWEILA